MQCVSEQEIHHRKDPIKRDTKEGNQKRRAKQDAGKKENWSVFLTLSWDEPYVYPEVINSIMFFHFFHCMLNEGATQEDL